VVYLAQVALHSAQLAAGSPQISHRCRFVLREDLPISERRQFYTGLVIQLYPRPTASLHLAERVAGSPMRRPCRLWLRQRPSGAPHRLALRAVPGSAAASPGIRPNHHFSFVSSPPAITLPSWAAAHSPILNWFSLR
jgi:hypothetical protein